MGFKALKMSLLQVEDLRNGALKHKHGSILKYYRDSHLYQEEIMSYVIAPETGMAVQPLKRLTETIEDLMVTVRWKGLPESEITLESVAKVFQEVTQWFRQLLERKSTPTGLAYKVRSALHLWGGE